MKILRQQEQQKPDALRGKFGREGFTEKEEEGA